MTAPKFERRSEDEREAVIVLDGWAGRIEERILVIGETPKRYRVRAPGPHPVKLAGPWRWLAPGEEALVPKTAIKFHDQLTRALADLAREETK